MFDAVLDDIQFKILEHRPTLILIDGPAGSGKTTLAELLANETTQILHLDDLYHGWDEPFDENFQSRISEAHQAHNVYSTKDSFSYYDWSEAELKTKLSNRKTETLIIEGVGSFLYSPATENLLRIFVTTSFLTGLNRVVQRDGDDSAPYIALWKQREFELFEKYELPADTDFYIST